MIVDRSFKAGIISRKDERSISRQTLSAAWRKSGDVLSSVFPAEAGIQSFFPGPRPPPRRRRAGTPVPRGSLGLATIFRSLGLRAGKFWFLVSNLGTGVLSSSNLPTKAPRQRGVLTPAARSPAPYVPRKNPPLIPPSTGGSSPSVGQASCPSLTPRPARSHRGGLGWGLLIRHRTCAGDTAGRDARPTFYSDAL
jgi:hypothetical protein